MSRGEKRTRAGQKCKLPPLPVAVHVGEPDIAEPPQLLVNIEELVRGVLLLRPDVEPRQEQVVQWQRRRCHVLQIAEDAARSQAR